MNMYSTSPVGSNNYMGIFQKSLTLLVSWKIVIPVPGESITEFNMCIGSRIKPKIGKIPYTQNRENTQYLKQK